METKDGVALEQFGLSANETEKNPGLIIKSFRERMMYEDQFTGKRKHWSQQDLATLLGLTKVQVCNMENHNEGLDSIARRKTLARILRIPPVLLGLASLDDIVEIVGGPNHTQKANDTRRTRITKQDIEKYQKTFKVYNALFAEGVSFASISAIENMTHRIQDDIQNAGAD